MGARAGYSHSAGAVVGDTVSGAAAGAGIGSFGGPIGTGIGAAVGGAAGFLTGLLTGDTPDPLAAPTPPPPPPDEVDAITQRAQLAKQARLMASGTGDFLTGSMGDASKAPGAAPKAGGY